MTLMSNKKRIKIVISFAVSLNKRLLKLFSFRINYSTFLTQISSLRMPKFEKDAKHYFSKNDRRCND